METKVECKQTNQKVRKWNLEEICSNHLILFHKVLEKLYFGEGVGV